MNHKPYEYTKTITPDHICMKTKINIQRVSSTAHCIKSTNTNTNTPDFCSCKSGFISHIPFSTALFRESRDFAARFILTFHQNFGLHVEYFNVLFSPTAHRVSIPARFISAFYLEPCYVHGPLSFVNVAVFYNQHHLFRGSLFKTSSRATVCDVKPTYLNLRADTAAIFPFLPFRSLLFIILIGLLLVASN